MPHRNASPPPTIAGIVLLEDCDIRRLQCSIHTATTRSSSTRTVDSCASRRQLTSPSHQLPRTDYTSHSATSQPRPPQSSIRLEGDRLSPAALLACDGISDEDDETAENDRNDHATGPHDSKSTLRISVSHILVGIVIGIVLGTVLYVLEPTPMVTRWIQLPGDLFVRALKCLMVPYIFCAVAVAFGDIVYVGKVSVVGAQTAKIFVLFWFTATVAGMIVAVLCRPYFRRFTTTNVGPTNTAIMGLTCANGKSLELLTNTSLACAANELNATENSTTTFFITDTKKNFKTSGAPEFRKLTVSQQLMSSLSGAISNNIFASLARGDLLSVITFAMILGTIAGRQYFTRSHKTNYLYLTLLQTRNTFFLMLEWVVALTPVAVISLIASSIGTSHGVFDYDTANYTYVAAVIFSAALQVFGIFPALVFLLTRCNPYKHMTNMAAAYTFAFGCSSSLATAPVTLSCVNRATVCSRSLANFVISLGVCSNTSASGFYYPIGVVYLIESSGLGDILTPWNLVLLFVLSMIGCAGSPPIPAGGIVVMTTIFRAVAGVDVIPPQSFAFVLAADFLIDRLATICNVNDDIMALKVIAETTDETVAAEYLGQRF